MATDKVNDGVEVVPAQEDVHRKLHGTEDEEKLAATPSPETSPPRRQPFSAVWIVIACGFALMSDGILVFHLSILTVGYLNSVMGTVNTILGIIYPDIYPNSSYSQNISSIVFAGTVLGQLLFGYLSDKFGRKFGMISATIIVVVFSILSAGSYGAGGSTTGMLAALAAYRFLLGIGIGAEYPAGSVAASEATSEAKQGHRHAMFVMVTNFVIDLGFVFGGFVPLVLLVCSPYWNRLTGPVDIRNGSSSCGMANCARSRCDSSALGVLLPIENEGGGSICDRQHASRQNPVLACHQEILDSSHPRVDNLVYLRLFILLVRYLQFHHYLSSYSKFCKPFTNDPLIVDFIHRPRMERRYSPLLHSRGSSWSLRD